VAIVPAAPVVTPAPDEMPVGLMRMRTTWSFGPDGRMVAPATISGGAHRAEVVGHADGGFTTIRSAGSPTDAFARRDVKGLCWTAHSYGSRTLTAVARNRHAGRNSGVHANRSEAAIGLFPQRAFARAWHDSVTGATECGLR
jgi:hypothetical protein